MSYQTEQPLPAPQHHATTLRAICLPCPPMYQGFSSWQELARLVWECDLSSYSLLAAFETWKRSDGSKVGLLKLPTRPEYLRRRHEVTRDSARDGASGE
ncbi:MAG TPA: hypothetical protein PKO06_02705 [Candidatus Ozemobacteraceae bacterium]|nr:hypothetical protein [Candidatus Ozemobacteraceae bacterium]